MWCDRPKDGQESGLIIEFWSWLLKLFLILILILRTIQNYYWFEKAHNNSWYWSPSSKFSMHGFFFHTWKKNSMHGKKNPWEPFDWSFNVPRVLQICLKCIRNGSFRFFLDYQLLHGPWQNTIAECWSSIGTLLLHKDLKR